ncbi:MAG: polyprenyl synthetase family protein [Dehalococcoidia bacterium]
MNLPSIFERYRSEVDSELRSIFVDHHLPLYQMMQYHLGWTDENGRHIEGTSGKALRPTLCLLACEAAGEYFHKALPAAAAIELVHNFSLIHDDIQDNDHERRHRPTVWSIWGIPQAINVGDGMRSVASLALLRLEDRDVPTEKQQRVQCLLDESCLRMIEGQYLDLSYEDRFDITVEDYLEMIDRKTAAIMSCALQTGAIIGTDDESVIKCLREFGRNIGLAFQIKDDIIGIWGDQDKTGKPLASDIRRKKKSLPVVYTLQSASGTTREDISNVYKKPSITDHEVGKVLDILDDVQAKAYAERMAEEYRNSALIELGKIRLSPWAKAHLEEIAYFLVERDF